MLIRTFLFIFFISALWALLPVIVSHELHLGSFGYGLLLGCIGLGAVMGSVVLPQIQRRIPVADRQVKAESETLACLCAEVAD